MASEVSFEISVLGLSLSPDHPFEAFINGEAISPSHSTFTVSPLSLTLTLSDGPISFQIPLLEDISEYSFPISSSDYEGFFSLSLALCPVLSLEDPSATPVNCRYLKNLSGSESFNEKTRGVLSHLEEIMGASYFKMLEDVVRPASPVRSPMKKNSKPGNKTPVRTPAGKSPYKRSLSGLSFDQGGVIEIPCNADIYMDKVSAKDARCLVLVVSALLAKRRLLRATDEEDEIIKSIIGNNKKAFEVMNAAFEETKAQMQTEKDEIWYSVQVIKDQIVEIGKQKGEVSRSNEELESVKEGLKREVKNTLDNIDLLRKISVESSEELMAEINVTRKLTQDSEEQRKEMQGSYMEFLSKFKAEMVEKDREISRRQDSLNKSITEFNQKDVQLTHTIQENTKIKGQILQATSELVVKLSIDDRFKLVCSLIEDDSNAIAALQSKLSEAQRRHENVCVETEREIQAIRHSKESLDKTQESVKESLESQSKEGANLSSALEGLHQSLAEIRSLYHKTSQLEQHFNALQRRLIFSYENKEHAVTEMKYLSDLILHLTSCYTSAHRSFVKSSNLLEQKNCEVTTIYEALGELKKKYPVYFPVKEDNLDMALGNYLNGRDLGLAVPFIREGGGVYFFGTRKILINYERQRLTVKVGGGFLPIEEFINAYSDVEVEKFMTKCQELSPKTKKFLGKWAGGLAENCENSKKAKELLSHAAEEHKYTISYAVKSPDRSVSPLRKSKTAFN